MSRIEKWIVISLIILLCGGIAVINGQQQFSGGQAVTVTSGTLAATQSGNWATRTQDGSGNAITSTSSALDINLKSGSIANTAFGVSAGTAKIGITYPLTGCGTTTFETGSPAGLSAMPTASTAITTTTTCVLSVFISNTSAGTLTATLTDNAGTPIAGLNAVSVLAGEARQLNFPNGLKLNAGIKAQASNTGITYYVLGLQ